MKTGRVKGRKTKGYFYRTGRGWYSKDGTRFVPLRFEHGEHIRDPRAHERDVKEAYARFLLEKHRRPMVQDATGILEICKVYLADTKQNGAPKTHADRADSPFDLCLGIPPEYRSRFEVPEFQDAGKGDTGSLSLASGCFSHRRRSIALMSGGMPITLSLLDFELETTTWTFCVSRETRSQVRARISPRGRPRYATYRKIRLGRSRGFAADRPPDTRLPDSQPFVVRESTAMPEREPLLDAGRFQVIRTYQVTADGEKLPRQIVQHPGAVVILPLLSDGRVVLIDNYRIAVDETLLELPAGTLEPDEDPLEAAHRELAEETGYRAGSMERLAQFVSSPGILTEQMHLFLASGLEQGPMSLEKGEQIRPRIFAWEEALSMARDGRIHDAKTLVGILFYDAFRLRR